MGIFSKFENKMEDGLEGAAGKLFNAPISPVQISKKAERAMRREKMVGAGKQYAPTLYTVLVNAEDDRHLFGYYPTLAGETETFLSAKAAEEGLTMDGQPLVRFIVDPNLRRGKFDVVAELVSAPIVAQLRREEMQRYGLLNKSGANKAGDHSAAAYTNNAEMAQQFQAGTTPAPAQSNDAAANAAPKKQPLPYVPEEEIDRSIDYGEYTFNSQDFEDYEKHGPSAQLITPSANQEDLSYEEVADLSGFDVEAYNPYTADSLDFEEKDSLEPGQEPELAPAIQVPMATPATPAPVATQASVTPTAAPAATPTAHTNVFVGSEVAPRPDTGAVRARLIQTSTNRDYDLVGGRLILGRSRSCDIAIDDINISRSHAELRYETQGSWVITDLGSTNGTHVNGQRITSHALTSGERILLGSTELLFLEG